MENHTVENSPLRMMFAVNPCHTRVNDSRNKPDGRKTSPRLDTPGRY